MLDFNLIKYKLYIFNLLIKLNYVQSTLHLSTFHYYQCAYLTVVFSGFKKSIFLVLRMIKMKYIILKYIFSNVRFGEGGVRWS